MIENVLRITPEPKSALEKFFFDAAKSGAAVDVMGICFRVVGYGGNQWFTFELKRVEAFVGQTTSFGDRRVDELNKVVSEQERELSVLRESLAKQGEALAIKDAPIPMRIVCPECRALHVDEGEFATKPHHTHACQACGNVWRPAIIATVGVRFLPGFKDREDG